MEADRHVFFSANDDYGRGEQWFIQSVLTKAFRLTLCSCFPLMRVGADRIQPVVNKVC